MLEERPGRAERSRCPYCHDDVDERQPARTCEVCQAVHHEDCWTGHGKCSGCGFGEARAEASAVAARRLPTGARRWQMQGHLGGSVRLAIVSLVGAVALFPLLVQPDWGPLRVVWAGGFLLLLLLTGSFLLGARSARAMQRSLVPPAASGEEERVTVGKETLRAVHVESVLVPADLPVRVPTRKLQAGQDYVLEASGVITVWDHVEEGLDAVYCYADWRVKDAPAVWHPLQEESGGFAELGGQHLDYDPGHVYRVRVTGEGKPLKFRVGDAVDNVGSYVDNRGEFIVRVLKVLEPEALDP